MKKDNAQMERAERAESELKELQQEYTFLSTSAGTAKQYDHIYFQEKEKRMTLSMSMFLNKEEYYKARTEQLEEGMKKIIDRSYNDPLGTSKVIDMRKIALQLLGEER